MKDVLKEKYGIKVPEILMKGQLQTFTIHHTEFVIVPISHVDEEELYELYQLNHYMNDKKEPYLATIVLTKENYLSFEHDENRYLLLKVPKTTFQPHAIGRDLARFHLKGRSYPYQISKAQRIGQWKMLWEKRLDQLEMFWRGKIYQESLHPFEKMFVEAFPYYLGLAENGIQYLVDTELDEDPHPIDSATICHHRFHKNTWLGDVQMKSPIDWVFDHHSRDLAEYMRFSFFHDQEEFKQYGYKFIEDYDRTSPLSPFSWRLIYSRLLFPVHFFECVENYYLSNGDTFYEDQLTSILDTSDQYEAFLQSYSSMLSMRTKRMVLPQVEWIMPVGK
ncbi:spore coat putative kinase YutH [Bacillus weihaiensis]|uniref:Spore coat protein YutH n=1 Tax=Bacillus weihaiensis TaxID=1547283 RepID=A0A1L3MN86_9BACI|nr:spore coat protein YutH [Bacillus weihaiensis]APH03806.1 spore coat protein YutH [Bacillus weihaiensis]